MTSELELRLAELKVISDKIKHNTFTRKTIGAHYPIGVGYASSTRRPLGDLLSWILRVEQILEILIEEATG